MNVLITGASRGIGFQTALRLSENPLLQIYALARNSQKLRELAQRAVHKNIHILEFDLAADDCSKISQWLDGLTINVLINNAAVLINKSFFDTSIEEWHRVFEINLFSIVKIINLLKDKFDKTKKSHILNIGSMGGFQGSTKFAGLSAYSVSKGALSVLTECLSVELLSENIAVNCLALGAVQTEMLSVAFPNYKPPISDEEIAKFIANFALEGMNYFNGKIIPVSFTNP
ncbi:MAG: SDR family oxidoreductase [Flammeovirgaceae bacterium]|nr:SDR family oxidoreductase [Flammeovirgaceae bacterium]MDW8288270.1 SDR family oxidoreductase [Flammeovirgaceae bacterium]